MNKTFGDVLREEMTARSVTAAELWRRSGVTKQQIGRIVNNDRSTFTGEVTKPSVETVDKLANGLGWNTDEARLAAGYAPKGDSDPYGLASGLSRLPPERRELAQRQIKAILDSLATDEDHIGNANAEPLTAKRQVQHHGDLGKDKVKKSA